MSKVVSGYKRNLLGAFGGPMSKCHVAKFLVIPCAHALIYLCNRPMRAGQVATYDWPLLDLSWYMRL